MLAIKWCMITLFVQLCFWFVVLSIFFYCNAYTLSTHTHQAWATAWRSINVTLLWASSCSFGSIHQIIYASTFLCIGQNVTLIQWYDRLFSSSPWSSWSIEWSKSFLFCLLHTCAFVFPFCTLPFSMRNSNADFHWHRIRPITVLWKTVTALHHSTIKCTF